MPLITTLQEIEKEFDKEFKERCFCCKSDYCEGDCDEYTRNKVKSFLTQSHIRLLESLKEELPEPIDETNPVHDFTGDPGEWNVARIGFNRCLSTIHQLIDNAIKSIEV